MAWRSSGTTNDEMVDNLKRFGVISTPAVEEAFRQVDRAFFVPAAEKDRAHSDQPLREGNLHISAPHIYGSVLEALELRPNSSLSFLNVGSGTGYMSCIVATILGSHSNNYGVEIFKDVVEHSKNASQRWKNSMTKPVPNIEWIHGNALNINPDKGEAVVGFDRIYIGAAVDKQHLPKLTCLLRPGGILVGPVEDELVKVVRIGSRTTNNSATSGNVTTTSARRRASSTSSASMMDTDDPNPLPPSEFTQQVLSGVRFASLVQRPNICTVLPSTIWNPSIHYQYPDSFRDSCREILLCSNASHQQKPPPVTPKSTVNVAGLLPRVLWMEILSYTHRDWFECPETETEFLRRRLLEEQESAQRAHQARMEAEARCQLAEEERDVYRVLARRYQLRLEAALRRSGRNHSSGSNNNNNSNQQHDATGTAAAAAAVGAGADDDDDDDDDDDEEEAVGGPLNGGRVLSGREQAVIFGLGAMLRSFQYESGGDDDEEEEEEDDADDIDEEDGDDVVAGAEEGERNNSNNNNHNDADAGGIMEEDNSINGHDNANEVMAEQDGEDDDDDDDDDSESEEDATYFPLGTQGMVASMSHASALVVHRPQRRAVSITSEDL